MISRVPIWVSGFTKSSNYINKNGEHPGINADIIHWKIVLKKEELNDDNWMYIGNESEAAIQQQLLMLKCGRDRVAIIRE